MQCVLPFRSDVNWRAHAGGDTPMQVQEPYSILIHDALLAFMVLPDESQQSIMNNVHTRGKEMKEDTLSLECADY